MRATLAIVLLGAGISLVLFAGLAPGSSGGGPECRAAQEAAASRAPKGIGDVEQAIFFAVLEGLYRDGVDTETARMLASTDEKSSAPLYFIQSCPLCMPAFNAMRVYAARPEFTGDKQQRSTFGPGLTAEIRAGLASPELPTRLDTFQGLIAAWTQSHLDRMRLTPEEHTKWQQWIGDLREKGNAILESYIRQGGPYGEAYRGWKKCAVCEGSNAGAM
jgi:hypothetical protein